MFLGQIYINFASNFIFCPKGSVRNVIHIHTQSTVNVDLIKMFLHTCRHNIDENDDGTVSYIGSKCVFRGDI